MILCLCYYRASAIYSADDLLRDRLLISIVWKSRKRLDHAVTAGCATSEEANETGELVDFDSPKKAGQCIQQIPEDCLITYPYIRLTNAYAVKNPTVPVKSP